MLRVIGRKVRVNSVVADQSLFPPPLPRTISLFRSILCHTFHFQILLSLSPSPSLSLSPLSFSPLSLSLSLPRIFSLSEIVVLRSPDIAGDISRPCSRSSRSLRSHASETEKYSPLRRWNPSTMDGSKCHTGKRFRPRFLYTVDANRCVSVFDTIMV